MASYCLPRRFSLDKHRAVINDPAHRSAPRPLSARFSRAHAVIGCVDMAHKRLPRRRRVTRRYTRTGSVH